MANPQLLVMFEELKSTVSEVNNKAVEYESDINQFRENISSLTGNWQSSTTQIIQDVSNESIDFFNQIKELMIEVKDIIDRKNNDFQDTESENTNYTQSHINI